MQKSARKQQNEADPIDDDMDTSSNTNHDTSAPNLANGTLEPSIANGNDNILLMLGQKPLPENSDCRAVADRIHAILPLNYLQRLIVEQVLDHVIKSKGKPPCTNSSDQMLLYVRGEGGTGKTRVVKAIELGFSLLDRREELIITAPTEAAASNIGGSTVHAAMSIETPGRRTPTLSNTWSSRTALIVDDISMVSLKLLGSMDSQIKKAKRMDANSSALFGGLSLVVLLGDFFNLVLWTVESRFGTIKLTRH